MLHPFRWQDLLPALHVAMQFGLYHLQIHGVWRIVSEDSLLAAINLSIVGSSQVAC